MISFDVNPEYEQDFIPERWNGQFKKHSSINPLRMEI
jgi:hypothetical protein